MLTSYIPKIKLMGFETFEYAWKNFEIITLSKYVHNSL